MQEPEVLVPDDDPERPQPMAWAAYVDAVLAQWHELLGRDPEEPEVQAFLELHPAMVPGGSGDVGPGGHHGSEFSIMWTRPVLKGAGRDLIPDFMWVTRSSGLITPILVEIEKPSKRWFQADGRPTADFRDAHDQLNDWRAWFARDENRSLFRGTYLLEDSHSNRPLEPQFVLVYGRKTEFEPGGGHRDPGALLSKRDTQRAAGESFYTFDALRPRYDHANSVTARMTARGPEALVFSPLYGTDTESGAMVLTVQGVAEALDRAVMLTDERKRYLRERLEHWRGVELAAREDRQVRIRRLGVE